MKRRSFISRLLAGAVALASLPLMGHAKPKESRGRAKHVDFKIESTEVGLKSRKLKVKWNAETTEDLRAFHSLDSYNIERERRTVREIQDEIDQQILRDVEFFDVEIR